MMENFAIYMVLLGLVLVVVGLLWVIRIRKRKPKKEIPEDVVKIFNEAERRWIQSQKDGSNTNNPFKELWATYRADFKYNGSRGIEGTSKESIIRKLSGQSSGGQELQVRTPEGIGGNKEGIIKPDGNSNKNFFSRFKRK